MRANPRLAEAVMDKESDELLKWFSLLGPGELEQAVRTVASENPWFFPQREITRANELLDAAKSVPKSASSTEAKKVNELSKQLSDALCREDAALSLSLEEQLADANYGLSHWLYNNRDVLTDRE